MLPEHRQICDCLSGPGDVMFFRIGSSMFLMVLMAACRPGPAGPVGGNCVYRTGLTPVAQPFILPGRPGSPLEPGQTPVIPETIGIHEYSPSKQISEYLVNLTVGGKELGFVADTGSSSLVVLGDRSICSNCESVSGVYTKSVDGMQFSHEFQVQYGSGQATNILFSDTVQFPCDPTDPLPKYQFGVVKNNNGLPNILGLAYPSLVQPNGLSKPILPLFDQFLTTHLDKAQDIIGITLCGDRPGSAIVFGGPDERITAQQRSGMIWVPIQKDPNRNTYNFYNIDALHVSVDGWKKDGSGKWVQDDFAKNTVLGDFGGAGSRGQLLTFVDTGSTLNRMPVKMNNEITALLKEVNIKTGANISPTFFDSTGLEGQAADIRADTVRLFPTFHLHVKIQSPNAGSDIASLAWPPEIYFKKNPPVASSNRRLFSFRNGSGAYVLGQAFLENWYVEHDRGQGRLGFYPNETLCTQDVGPAADVRP